MFMFVAALTSGLAFYFVVTAAFLAADSYKTRKNLPLAIAAVLVGAGTTFATCAISMLAAASG